MHRILLGALAGCALAATSIGIATAQNIPSGSYTASCTNVRMRGNELMARCTNANGTSVRSQLDVSNCRGDISNNNGQLTCANTGRRGWHRDNGYGNGGYNNGNGYGNRGYNGNYNGNGDRYRRGTDYWNGGSYRIPGGSYQQSCTNARIRSGNVLTATCTSANGNQVNTSLQLGSCRGYDILNNNGQLACG